MRIPRRLALATVAVTFVLLWSRDPDPPLPGGAVADRVLIEKAERRLTLYAGARVLKTYRVALGRNPVGPKQREGDGRTPEGRYVIAGRNPGSAFHLSLRISYPGPDDLRRARTAGVSPGSNIMIHGLRPGIGWIGSLHRVTDWTAGCIAVTNAEMDELWRAVADGTPVDVVP